MKRLMTRPYDAADAEDFARWLADDPTTLAVRMFPEVGVYTAARRLLFHWTLIYGRVGDRQSIDDRWCYATPAGALEALAAWDAAEGGEPEGWHKHPATGRRRPAGQPGFEVSA